MSSSAVSGTSSPKQDVARVGMRLGRYELDGELGEGGMASVFSATDTKLGRKVAVKVLFPHLAKRKEAASRFKREARAAAGLDHEHILRVLDVGGGEVVGDVLEPPYIVLERIDGSDLGEYFGETNIPMAEIVAAIGVTMCSALEVAHEQGVVHRDIKPANIMVTDKGRIVLADFGVARVNDEDSVVTRTGSLLGTPAYMSPEQATGDEVDARSDVYSLGATLYKIATGSFPYGGGTAQVVASILSGNRQEAQRLRPAVGGELSRVIERMMHRDVDQRYSSASEAKAALQEIVTGGGYPDADKLLRSFFCDPVALEKTMPAKVMATSIARAARLATQGRKALALSLGERVLLMDPDNIQARAIVRNLVTGKNPQVWVAVAGPMVVTGAVAFAFWGYSPGEAPPIYVEDAAPLDATTLVDAGAAKDAAYNVQPGSVQPGSVQPGDIADANGDTAPANADVRTKKPRIRPKEELKLSPDASPLVGQPDPIDAGSGQALVPAIALKPASLIVNIRPWCDVWVDGAKVGRASASTVFSVSPGTHRVECKQETTDLSWSKTVTLKPGEKKTLMGSVLSAVPLTLRLSKGDSAKIDGLLYKNGATHSFKAGRHRIEVYKDGKSISAAEYLDLRERCTLRDKPNLGCFKR
ncbi:MAG: serine/threonine protein kinase [Kofleriaceae bacterium]|nr:serine/threonine protein kinase [Kofleriaceae bacterium]